MTSMKNTTFAKITISNELRRLLISLETNCIADCCKSSAFDINVPNIKKSLELEDNDTGDKIYLELFELLNNDYSNFDKVKLTARKLESEWNTKEFLTFIESVTKSLHKAQYPVT